jgi:hypothetical protein
MSVQKDNSPQGVFYRIAATTVGSAAIGGAIGNWLAGPAGLLGGIFVGGLIGFGISKYEASQP